MVFKFKDNKRTQILVGRSSSVIYASICTKNGSKGEQAGAELCQAQVKLGWVGLNCKLFLTKNLESTLANINSSEILFISWKWNGFQLLKTLVFLYWASGSWHQYRQRWQA